MLAISLQRRREELAREEVGQTTVRPWLAWILVAHFVAVIYAVSIIQATSDHPSSQSGAAPLQRQFARVFTRSPEDAQSDGGPLSRVFQVNRALLSELNRLEDDLEDTSRTAQLVRPPTQYLLAALLGAGNEQAYRGRSAWLFYRQDLDSLTNPGFLDQAQRAILHFKAQLDAEGSSSSSCRPLSSQRSILSASPVTSNVGRSPSRRLGTRR